MDEDSHTQICGQTGNVTMRPGGVRVLWLELWQPLCDSEYRAKRFAGKLVGSPDVATSATGNL